MKPKVYIETTIVSYLTARPSRDIQLYAHQLLTQAWWRDQLQHYDAFTSELVLSEAARGDPTAAQERLSVLNALPLLQSNDRVLPLAEHLMRVLTLPQHVVADAVHVAIAATNGMHFLVTWNCTHLANANLADRMEQACEAFAAKSPRVVTPEQLMELL